MLLWHVKTVTVMWTVALPAKTLIIRSFWIWNLLKSQIIKKKWFSEKKINQGLNSIAAYCRTTKCWISEQSFWHKKIFKFLLNAKQNLWNKNCFRARPKRLGGLSYDAFWRSWMTWQEVNQTKIKSSSICPLSRLRYRKHALFSLSWHAPGN